MNRVGAWCVMVVLAVVGAQAAAAQEVSRYRDYVLASSLESVIAESGARATEVKTVHQRPGTIHKLEWRAPYVSSERERPDPVRGIAFTFYNEALYQIVVTYDRDRTDGLTGNDIVESLTATYGPPVARPARSRPASPLPERSVVLARWESDASSMTLLRDAYDAYSPEFQLILISKALNERAGQAIREAIRLDALEAPRRELEQRKKDAADASAAREKARTTNKDAFRP
jgi:hypothetical protein